MEQNLLSGALNLTLFGMGFVFIFLTILVFVIKLMSFLLNKNKAKINDNKQENSLITESDIDEETKFVIQQAIKMHTGA